MSELEKLKKDLRNFERPEKAKALRWFFKTGKGEYGEGDVFLGLMTDETRSVAKKYLDLPLSNIGELLASEIHEERIVAVMILTRRFEKAELAGKKEIFDFYFANIAGINNWDLVDGSALTIVGGYLFKTGEPRKILYDLVKSNDLWKKKNWYDGLFLFYQAKRFYRCFENCRDFGARQS